MFNKKNQSSATNYTLGAFMPIRPSEDFHHSFEEKLLKFENKFERGNFTSKTLKKIHKNRLPNHNRNHTKNGNFSLGAFNTPMRPRNHDQPFKINSEIF